MNCTGNMMFLSPEDLAFAQTRRNNIEITNHGIATLRIQMHHNPIYVCK